MAFKDTNWHPGAIRHTIVDIVLADTLGVRDAAYTALGASPTMRLCDGGDVEEYGNLSFGGNLYSPGLVDMDVNAGAVLFGEGLQDADAQIVLSNHRHVWQVRASAAPQETTELDVKLSQVLRNYAVVSVTITKLARLPNTMTYDSQQIYTGVGFNVDGDEDRVYLYSVEDRRYDKELPNMASPTGGIGPGVITKKDYPKAPKSTFGEKLPVLYSQNVNTIMFGLPSAYLGDGLLTNPRYMLGLAPCKMVEAVYDATGPGRVTRIVANKFPALTAGGPYEYFMWVPEINTLASIQGSASDTTTESYTDFPNQGVASIWINPNQFKASSGVTNPGYAFDGRHDTKAVIACTGATAYLEFYLPYLSSLGRIKEVYFSVLWAASSTGAGAAAGTLNARFGIWNGDAGVADWHFKDASDTTNPMKLTKNDLNSAGVGGSTSGAWIKGTSKWDDPREPWGRWQWEGSDSAGNRQDCYGRIEVSQNGANLDVISCGLLIEFYPFAATFPTAGGQTGRTLKK